MKKLTLTLTIVLFLTGINTLFAQNNALDFDGTNDYITCGSFDLSEGSFSIEGWFKADDFPGSGAYYHLFGLESGLDAALCRINSAQQLEFIMGHLSGTKSLVSSTVLQAGKWYHATIHYDYSLGYMNLWLNGKQIAFSNPVSGSTFNYSNQVFSIGGSPTAGRYFNGQIDDVKVWKYYQAGNSRDENSTRTEMYKEIVGNESGLYAYYKLNETSGTTANDAQTSSSYDGTLTNMTGNEWTTSSAFFGPKNCLDFDGIDDYVVRSAGGVISGNTDMTLEAWLFADNTGSKQCLIGQRDDGGYNGQFMFQINSDGTLGFWDYGDESFGFSENATTTGASIGTGAWHHVTAVKEGANLYYYIDGINVATEARSGSAKSYDGNLNLCIGDDDRDNDVPFNGKMDEIRIWSDARTATEIRENMCSNLIGNESGLVAYYNLDNLSGTTLQDFTGNYNDGTLTNMNPANVWVSSTAFNTWLNTNSTDLATATNWSDGGLPTSTDNVGIPNYSGGSQPTAGAALACNNLVVGSSTTLTFNYTGSHTIHGSAFVIGTSDINSDNLLTVTGSLYVLPLATLNVKAGGQLTVSTNLEVLTTGALTLNSTVSGTGSLIVNGTTTGDVVQERYIAAATWGTWNDGWHFLSSPVTDYPIQDNFTVATASEYDFYAWSEPDNLWINFKTGDSPSFNDVNGSTTFELGQGYMAAYASTSTKNFTGTINVSDIAITGLTITGTSADNRSFHLLGNPYNSALSWYTDWTTNGNISGTAHIWNEINQSYSTLSAGDPIPATNGFMVQASSGTGTLTIPEAKRVHSTTAFYKNQGYPIIKLKANNIDIPSAQESQLRFNPESTVGWDLEFDGDFLPGFAPYFYSFAEGVPQAVNSMPDVTEATTIPFTFIKNEGLNFSIEMYEEENMELDVWLFDTKLNKDHNLTLNPTYFFTAFENDDPNRFEIHFSPVGINDQEKDNDLIQLWSSDNKINIYNSYNITGEIKVYNMFGQVIEKTSLNSNVNQQIDLVVPDGYYIVNIVTSQQIINKKVYLR
jgi:concanavalin A-like lectin/glucanase superfamily protein